MIGTEPTQTNRAAPEVAAAVAESVGKPPGRISKGARARESKALSERDQYRADVAQDLSMHHTVIGQLVQQVTLLIQRVKKLEEAQPKIEIVQSLPGG